MELKVETWKFCSAVCTDVNRDVY